MQHWIAANQRAIAQMKNPRNRLMAQQRFAQTRANLTREEGRRLTNSPAQDPRQLARRILSNARLYRFTQPARPYPRPWWQRAIEWLGERWSRVMRALFGRARLPARLNRGIADVLLVLSILIFVALLGRIIWLYGRRSHLKQVAVPLKVPDNPSSLLDASIRTAERGNYALAVAQLFSAAVALLTVKKRFDGRASETAREMSRRIGSADARLGVPFDELTDDLTRAVYAERPLQQDDWKRSLGAYRRLEGLVQT